MNGCYRMSDKACSRMSEMYTLKKVDISGCRYVTDMGVRELSQLPYLVELVMSGLLGFVDTFVWSYCLC